MKIKIEFEFDEKEPYRRPDGDPLYGAEALHEALCRSIYEDETEASEWLSNIQDLNIIEEV